MATSAAVIPQASGRARAASGSPTAASARPILRAAPRRRKIQSTKSPEEHRTHDPRLDERRNVERVRAEVGPAGDELVVDGEVVQPEAEDRVRRQHVRNEPVDLEVRRSGGGARVRARAEHREEEVEPREDDRPDERDDRSERNEERRSSEVPPVRERQDRALRTRARAGRSATASPARRRAGRRGSRRGASATDDPARAGGRAE